MHTNKLNRNKLKDSNIALSLITTPPTQKFAIECGSVRVRSADKDGFSLFSLIISHHLSSSLIISHHLSSSLIISHHLSSSLIISHHLSSSLITSHHLSSSLIISHHLSPPLTTSHHLSPPLTTSHHHLQRLPHREKLLQKPTNTQPPPLYSR
jgi:hypothetical protein